MVKREGNKLIWVEPKAALHRDVSSAVTELAVPLKHLVLVRFVSDGWGKTDGSLLLYGIIQG